MSYKILVVVLLVLSLSISVFADQLPAAMGKGNSPGITYVTSSGHHFYCPTTVLIHLSFLPNSFTFIELRFTALQVYSGTGDKKQASISGPHFSSLMEGNNNNGNGPPPEDPEDPESAESGFTEK